MAKRRKSCPLPKEIYENISLMFVIGFIASFIANTFAFGVTRGELR